MTALCIETLSGNAQLPILEILGLCHERLRGTRGATISVVSFDYMRHEVTWSGLGNVAGVLLRSGAVARPRAESLVQRAGLLGSGSPAMTFSCLPVRHGDLVVLATDGIDPEFERSVDASLSPQAAAERILANHAKGTDDALVLVSRYVGGSA